MGVVYPTMAKVKPDPAFCLCLIIVLTHILLPQVSVKKGGRIIPTNKQTSGTEISNFVRFGKSKERRETLLFVGVLYPNSKALVGKDK